jgi:hypothetical protein
VLIVNELNNLFINTIENNARIESLLSSNKIFCLSNNLEMQRNHQTDDKIWEHIKSTNKGVISRERFSGLFQLA